MARTQYRVADGGLLEIFSSSNTYRGIFSTSASGEVQLNAPGAFSLLNSARTLKSNTGDLNVQTGAANGNIILTPHGTGKVSVNYLTNTKVVFTDASNYLSSTGTVAIAQGGTGSTSFSAGSIIFSNGTILTEDNSNLYWDDTNNRIGIGTTAPFSSIHANTGATPTRTHIKLTANSAGALSLNTYAVDSSWIGFDVDYDSAYIARHTSASLILKSSDNLNFYANTSLTSGNSFTPTLRWSVLGASGILQSNGAQTIQTSTGKLTIATAAGNGDIVLIPNGSGKVGISTASPSVALDVTGEGKFSSYVTGVTPSSGSHLATKDYVDTAATGYIIKTACRVATTAALAATYNSGTLSYTATSNGAISLDSVSLSLNDRVLIKNQSTQSENGIAYVAQVGDGSNPYILTRTTDADTGAELVKAYVFITAGSTNIATSWVQTTPATITLDTTSIVWEKFFQASAYVAGNGIDLTGTTFSTKISAATTYTLGAVVFSDSTSTLDQDSNFLFDNDNDSLTIGTSSAATNTSLYLYRQGAKTATNYALNISNVATSSTASINKFGLNLSSSGTWNGTSANNYGIYLDTVSGGTNNWALYNNSGANVYLGTNNVCIGTTTATSRLMIRGSAGLLDIGDSSSASLETLTSIYQNYTGSSAAYGLYVNRYQQTNANVNAIYGINGLGGAVNLGANTLSSAVGIYGKAYQSGTGTLTNAYSIFAETPTGTITNSWNFYASGSAYNYFGGNVGILTSSPSSALSVGSASNFQVDSNGRVKLNNSSDSFGTFCLSFGNATSFSTSSSIYGITGRIVNSSSGSVYGSFIEAGTTYAGSISFLLGSATRVYLNNVSASVSQAFGNYVAQPLITAGVISTSYANYIDSQKITGVTTGYGIYQVGVNDYNYFGGNTGFGFTMPAGKVCIDGGLHVGGSTDAGDNNLIIDGITSISGSAFASSVPLTITKSSTYSTENTAALYLYSIAADTAVIFGADASNDIGYIQSLQSGTSWTNRPLVLQPNGGSVGIGVTTVDAKLHLPAGTTTIAPIKLTSGSILTSSSEGALEYDGIDLYFTNSVERYTLARGVSGGSTGTPNTVVKWSSSGTSLENSIILENSGGIVATLTQNDSSAITMYNASTGNNAVSGFIANSDGGEATFYAYGASHSAWADTAKISASSSLSNGLVISSDAAAPIRFNINGSEKGRFTSTGLFGIGISIGLTRLFEIGGNTSPYMAFSPSATNNKFTIGSDSVGFMLYDDTNSQYRAAFSKTAGSGLSIGSTYYATAAPTGGLIIEGNQGIGIASPSHRLHIYQDINSYVYSFIQNPNTGNAAYSGYVLGSNDGQGGIYLYNSNHSTSPDVLMVVAENNVSNGIIINSAASAPIKFQTNNLLRGQFYSDGNFAIGTHTPTAYLHIKAGTATVSTAPLKFITGVNLTTPEAGSMEFSSSILYFTPASSRYKVLLEDSSTYGISISGNAATASAVANTLSVSSPLSFTSGSSYNGSTARTIQLGTVTVAKGGTGATSFSTDEFILYNGISGTLESSGYGVSDFASSSHGGTTGKIAKFASSTTFADSILTENSSKIGINTTPSETLHILSNSNTKFLIEGTNNDFIHLKRTSVSDWYIGDSSGGFAIDNSSLASAATKFCISSSGYVGIGTASISHLLHLYKDTNSYVYSCIQNPNAGNAAFSGYILRSDDGQGGIYLYNANHATSPDLFLISSESNVSNGMGLYVGASAPLKFYTNALLRGQFYSNGNFAIGTHTPTAYLHLKSGTATASTAPIKFNTGTNLTTPEEGTMEFSSNILYFTPSSTRRKIVLEDSGTYAINISGNAATATSATSATTATTATTANSVANALSVSSPLSFASGSSYNGSAARTIQFSHGGTTSYLAKFTSSTGFSNSIISDNGTYAILNAASDVNVLATLITGNTYHPWYISASGVQNWGDGISSQDTNLYRGAANQLKTDDSLYIVNNLGVGISPSYKIHVSTGTSTAIYSTTAGGTGWSFDGHNTDGGGDRYVQLAGPTYAGIFMNGNVGFGTTSPTAKIHLAAGTAAVSTAPLKFTTGTNLTTPEAGVMEFSSSILYFTPSSTRRKVVLEDSGTYAIAISGNAATVSALSNALSLSSAFTYNSGTTFDGSAARTLQLATVALASGGTNNTSYSTSGGFIYYDGSKLIDNSILKISGSNIGIGSSPTARLHLAAGTATASTAPLKFTTGTNLTTPEAGAMEFSSSLLYFTPSSTRYKVVLEDAGSWNISISGDASTCTTAAKTQAALSVSSPLSFSSGSTFDGNVARTLQLGTVPIASGGTNATSFTTTEGFVLYDGTRLTASSLVKWDTGISSLIAPSFAIVSGSTQYITIGAYTINSAAGDLYLSSSGSSSINISPGSLSVIEAKQIGGALKLAFFGGTPVIKQTVSTAAISDTADSTYSSNEQTMLGNIKSLLNEIRAALVAYGLM